jgi:hypothetical protein
MRSTWALVHGCLILVRSTDARCHFPPAPHVEHMLHVSCSRAIRVARRESDLDPTVSDTVDHVANRRDQNFEEDRGGGPSCLLDRSHRGELASTIDGYIEVELAFSGLDIGDIDVEIADRMTP